LHAYETVSTARHGIGSYLAFYNGQRPHTALDGETPDAFYYHHLPALQEAV
jgi:putative transposase